MKDVFVPNMVYMEKKGKHGLKNGNNLLVQTYVHVPVKGKSFASLALHRCECIQTARHNFTLLAA